MKLQTRQIDGFIKSPPANICAVLVYGPDDGLMRERAKALGKTVVSDLNDPFNVSILKTDQIVADPARLNDEARAISMMGGRRLIRIEDGRDALTTWLKEYLADPASAALIVIEAGELNTRSPLRLLFEKMDNAAALPCYVEDERDIAAFARTTLQEGGYAIAPDALSWLAAAIAGDRQRARREVEKLMTYMGDIKRIETEDVQLCCGDAGSQSLDTLVYSAAGSKPVEALRCYNALLEEGIPAIAILRALQNHFRRLHVTRARLDAGENPDAALKLLSPPVFFKQESLFRAQMQRWSAAHLETVMQRLNGLEAQCKQTGSPAETLCSQALLAISSR